MSKDENFELWIAKQKFFSPMRRRIRALVP